MRCGPAQCQNGSLQLFRGARVSRVLLLAFICVRLALPVSLVAGETERIQGPIQDIKATQADHIEIRQVISGAHVDTKVPSPEWSGYLTLLAERAVEWIAARLQPFGKFLGHSLKTAGYIIKGIVLLAALLLILMLVALAVQYYQRKRRRQPTPDSLITFQPDLVQSLFDREEWRREFDRRFEAGDMAGAIEALWWWFARSIAGSKVEASWTTRELIQSAGRIDLQNFVGPLDKMAYGTARPDSDEVHRLRTRIEESLS